MVRSLMMIAEVVIMTHKTPDRAIQPQAIRPDAIRPDAIHPDLHRRFDVAVVGGGAAGLSAALVLARSRRAVLVIDAGQPRNAPAAGVHGFLTRDGIGPLEFL